MTYVTHLEEIKRRIAGEGGHVNASVEQWWKLHHHEIFLLIVLIIQFLITDTIFFQHKVRKTRLFESIKPIDD